MGRIAVDGNEVACAASHEAGYSNGKVPDNCLFAGGVYNGEIGAMTGFVEEVRRADGVIESQAEAQGEGVCLVDFCASWCDVCQVTWTLSETLAERYGGRLALRHVDVDDHPELAARYQVYTVPTLVLLKDGEVVERFIGGAPRERICAAVERAM